MRYAEMSRRGKQVAETCTTVRLVYKKRQKGYNLPIREAGAEV